MTLRFFFFFFLGKFHSYVQLWRKIMTSHRGRNLHGKETICRQVVYVILIHVPQVSVDFFFFSFFSWIKKFILDSKNVLR